jgi:cytochrome c oxidase assembly protein subunit 15
MSQGEEALQVHPVTWGRSRLLRPLVALWELTTAPKFLRASALTSVGALAVGIVSGGAVRLTGSGLGCSDWPACTRTSVVAPLQYHAWVEFGNRLVNVLITVGIVAVALAALRRRPRRRDLTSLASALVAGIFAEVVLGGETVLHKLSPQFVMAHFLLAVALTVDAVVLYHRSRQPDVLSAAGVARLAPAKCLVRRYHLAAARAMFALTLVVVALGTVVTSTGPHAGAPGVPRFHFSLHSVAQLHGSSVEVLLALTVATLWSMYRARVPPRVLRRGEGLLLVLASQAAVGYTQYFTGDPVYLVGLHLAGATAAVIAMTAFNLGLYERPRPEALPLPAGEPSPELAAL